MWSTFVIFTVPKWQSLLTFFKKETNSNFWIPVGENNHNEKFKLDFAQRNSLFKMFKFWIIVIKTKAELLTKECIRKKDRCRDKNDILGVLK